MELEAISRYTGPGKPAVFPHLTMVLLATAMHFTTWFFVYEVTSIRHPWDTYKDPLLLVTLFFMGFGVLFQLLWIGIYI
ncbi:transmembrane protein 258-like [Ursus arctos]|uniref:transmembrane protein 258-like n=1 Tax=Ursus arctos TaxID=9644 RepID=UPI002017D9E7|nr:transmembrane protein 258-like [Ursus arctos]